MAPTGGPPDTTPPRILSTYPQHNATHVTDPRIALEFDEYVDKRTVEESIFISPYVGELEFEWSGKEVEVRFSRPLRENTTYVVNVGTDVLDLRGRNRMVEAFTLAFSTGAEIDRCAIGGKVYPAKESDRVEGVMIFAYWLDDVNPDTLRPHVVGPDYITQTGRQGNFLLSHLRFGRYRVFAVRDENRNLLYDPEVDEYGTLPSDIVLSGRDSVRLGVLMRLAKEDTTAPRLLKASPGDRHHLVLEFSEPLDTATISIKNIAIRDTLTNTSLPVQSISPRLFKHSEYFVVTEAQQQDRPYRVTVLGVRDTAGHAIHPLASSLGFIGNGSDDTLRPTVVAFSLKDSARGVDPRTIILVSFADAVFSASRGEAARLVDSSGVQVPVLSRWLNDLTLFVRPVKPLRGNMWYTLRIAEGGLQDFQRTRGLDTVRVLRFMTIDTELFSSIEGVVEDVSGSDTTGGILVHARRVDAKEERLYELRLPYPGSFILQDLLEGRYVLGAVRDRNSNGRFDPGLPFPFVPSERFVVLPDTFRLRARWPIDGVRIELK